MIEKYAELRAALENAGFFTSFQPIGDAGDRMICASCKFASGSRGNLGGNTFWVAKRAEQWYIATWSPMFYRIADQTRLAELCIRLLHREPSGAYADFDENVRTEFSLTQIPGGEFMEVPEPA